MALATFTSIQEAYEVNADYIESASVTKAKAFITACTKLIQRLPAESTNKDVTVRMQVELIASERRAAVQWLRANAGEGRRRTGAAFREMRR